MPIRVFLFHSNGTFKASDSLQHHADVFTQDMMEADANSEGWVPHIIVVRVLLKI